MRECSRTVHGIMKSDRQTIGRKQKESDAQLVRHQRFGTNDAF
jgi:hypothetical protein